MMLASIHKEDELRRAKKYPKKIVNRSDVVSKRIDKSIEIYGVPLFGTHINQVLATLWFQRKKMLHVATVNSEYIMEARRNPAFQSILSQCLTVADGHGVVWAVQLLHNRMIDRISGAELVEHILVRASQKGEKVFLLGAAEGVAEQAAKEMSTKYPGLQIWSYSGAKTVQVEASEEASMTIAKINSVEPDYLFVAYGSPAQDLWIEENRPYLRVRVAIGIGGVLDEWAGVVRRCPAWMDEMGLKWAWRLVTQPWRWRRILTVLYFAALVMYHKLID